MACKRSSVRFRLAPPSFARCASFVQTGPMLLRAKDVPPKPEGAGGHPISSLSTFPALAARASSRQAQRSCERRMSRRSLKAQADTPSPASQPFRRSLRELRPGRPNALAGGGCLVRKENKAPPRLRWGLVSIRWGLAGRAGYRPHCAGAGVVPPGCRGIRRHPRIRGNHHSAGACRRAVRRV